MKTNLQKNLIRNKVNLMCEKMNMICNKFWSAKPVVVFPLL